MCRSSCVASGYNRGVWCPHLKRSYLKIAIMGERHWHCRELERGGRPGTCSRLGRCREADDYASAEISSPSSPPPPPPFFPPSPSSCILTPHFGFLARLSVSTAPQLVQGHTIPASTQTISKRSSQSLAVALIAGESCFDIEETNEAD